MIYPHSPRREQFYRSNFAQNRVGGLEMSALETGVVICEKQSGIIIVALHKRQFAKWKEATIRYKQAL
ncbi:MAG: hypothetical protein CNF02_09835 [OM182 bacterium MED-G28]|uniref:Uncharacterized protein n=1 Tax=OM182 bacterium MED-G28 TaxID=1986256 RepID=A0A2A5W9B9_9GAMM|nr:MAG: hypothetical protein CNF02_09835 [OM182 bacterium MED-G28]